MGSELRLATVFSGIGAAEQAVKHLAIPFKTVFACDNGERYVDIDVDETWDIIQEMSRDEQRQYIDDIYARTGKRNKVKDTYMMNHAIDLADWYEDIRFIDGNHYKDKVDLIVGGSPCQPFSIIGKRSGFNDVRGTLFYDYARLIKEIEPKAFIFENVGGLLSHDQGRTWDAMEDVFKNTLKYQIFGPVVLNAIDFGVPQDRNRVFVIGFKRPVDHFSFPEETAPLDDIADFLDLGPVYFKHYLGEKGFKFVTSPKYKNRARILGSVIQTQKANQQFNWNGDFVFQPISEVKDNADIMSRAYVGEYKGQKGVIRQLTHRECYRLMGFPDSFHIIKNNVAAYRQAGNSIVVPILEALIDEITKVLEIDEED